MVHVVARWQCAQQLLKFCRAEEPKAKVGPDWKSIVTDGTAHVAKREDAFETASQRCEAVSGELLLAGVCVVGALCAEPRCANESSSRMNSTFF